MTQEPLTSSEIYSLSWLLMGEIIKSIPGDICIADLHPGDGTYDCLSVIDAHEGTVLMMNREGSSAMCAGEIISDIWERAASKGPLECAFHILSESNLGVDTEPAPGRIELQDTCRRVARWLRQNSKANDVRAVCLWLDHPQFVGPAESLIAKVIIPDKWKEMASPYPGADWQGWIYAMVVGDTVHGIVHMKSGEALLPDGSRWDAWYEKLAAVSLVRPRGKSTNKVFSMPVTLPHPDAQKYFSKVGKFDGYQVLGKELPFIAKAVTEHWYETGELPTELEQLKGTLFYAWRSSRFIDGFPDDGDMPFLKALADAIDELEA